MLIMAKRRKTSVRIPTPEEIRAIREKLYFSQAEAAERVGVSMRTWYHWEAGARIPSESCAILIALLKDRKI